MPVEYRYHPDPARWCSSTGQAEERIVEKVHARRRTATAVAVCLIATAAFWSVGPSVTSVSAASAASKLVPVTPCRLADTRDGTGFTRLDDHTIRVVAGGRCGVSSSATALALSVVAVQPGGSGFVTVYPTGATRPEASNLNFSTGQIRANAAIVAVGAGATFDLYTTTGDVVVDVTGAFVASGATTSGRFVAATPDRMIDTRASARIQPGGTLTVPLPAGVPADAAALALNVTVTDSTGPGFVTSFPAGTTRPDASSLNLDAVGQTRAAGGVYAVSSSGISFFLSGGPGLADRVEVER
jgi:hypothetical protein